LKIQSIIQDNEDFKRNVKQELEGLRQYLVQQHPTLSTTSSTASSSPTNSGTQSGNQPNLNLPSPSMTTSSCVIPPSNLGGSIDTQNQVMLMLAETFYYDGSREK
jgi:hypothetical protein